MSTKPLYENQTEKLMCTPEYIISFSNEFPLDISAEQSLHITIHFWCIHTINMFTCCSLCVYETVLETMISGLKKKCEQNFALLDECFQFLKCWCLTNENHKKL